MLPALLGYFAFCLTVIAVCMIVLATRKPIADPIGESAKIENLSCADPIGESAPPDHRPAIREALLHAEREHHDHAKQHHFHADQARTAIAQRTVRALHAQGVIITEEQALAELP